MNTILAIDQGTSSTRALLFNEQGQCLATAQQAINQYYPQSGYVEHDAEEIWQKTLSVMNQVVSKAPGGIASIQCAGITNQRETSVIWDKTTGNTLGPAIVWQDRRTMDLCQQLKRSGDEIILQKKTGLLCDPYFSATKLQWMLNHYEHAQQLATQGRLAFGTIDSFLMWRLSAGRAHVTDVTNASRSLLFNIKTLEWDEECLKIFNIPHSVLPKVLPNAAYFCEIDKKFLGKNIPITGCAGDQQAASIGQACFNKGMIKATYGTGGFLLLNTGDTVYHSEHGLLSTIAYQINNTVCYALEGSIFNVGSTIGWCVNHAKLLASAPDSEAIAQHCKADDEVFFIPAFTGMGAPYWDPNAKAAIMGLTPSTGRESIVKAALTSIAYQTRDILSLMRKHKGLKDMECRIDGGLTHNKWLLQTIADLNPGIPFRQTHSAELTALGAAFLAGLGHGLYQSLDDIQHLWHEQQCWQGQLNTETATQRYQQWQDAVRRIVGSNPDI